MMFFSRNRNLSAQANPDVFNAKSKKIIENRVRAEVRERFQAILTLPSAIGREDLAARLAAGGALPADADKALQLSGEPVDVQKSAYIEPFEIKAMRQTIAENEEIENDHR